MEGEAKRELGESHRLKFPSFRLYGRPGNLRWSVSWAAVGAGAGTAPLLGEDIPFVSWAKNPRCGLPQESVGGRALG